MNINLAKDCDHGNGQPGITLWNMLVLETIRQGQKYDNDRLEGMANEYVTLRQILQYPEEVDFEYKASNPKDTVDPLVPKVFGQRCRR